jgi:hypothetical protein
MLAWATVSNLDLAPPCFHRVSAHSHDDAFHFAFATQADMAKLTDELVSGYKSMAAKGVTLATRLGEGLPPTAYIDPLRVKQVLSNGLTNALKNTKTGSVVLQVGTCSAFSAEQGFAVFSTFLLLTLSSRCLIDRRTLRRCRTGSLPCFCRSSTLDRGCKGSPTRPCLTRRQSLVRALPLRLR